MRTAVLLSKGRFNLPSAGKDPALVRNNMHGAAILNSAGPGVNWIDKARQIARNHSFGGCLRTLHFRSRWYAYADEPNLLLDFGARFCFRLVRSGGGPAAAGDALGG
jgi:hypothetical protein